MKHFKMKTKWEDGASLERLMCVLGSKEEEKRGLCLQVRDEGKETTKCSRLERDQSNRDLWMLES